uniref:DNA helicase n=1 Tax=Albugo laibachii Nc14 TaxID=890382 RepID=F0WR76_9STRA|nr:DNA polymerase alphaassociated DNA helicase A putati [Albugo laibachii Nc14]|eukprot:CCA23837.1 DNA polymerase alphaassociated DNA helicase A putati [Albugo laibachii Nc14]
MEGALYAWIEQQKCLLTCEQNEEITQMQQELDVLDDRANPNVLQHLQLVQSSLGLFGRTVWTLALPRWHWTTKAHAFSIGDIVRIRNASSTSDKIQTTNQCTSVVTKLEEFCIHIAMQASDSETKSESDIGGRGAITVDRLVNTTTYSKLSATLEGICKGDHPLISILFENQLPQWSESRSIDPFNPHLNTSQLESIKLALASKDIAIIHGPPGTGKTTTIVELILQAVIHNKQKVLVCAPSNIAVDTVLEKLSQCPAISQYKVRLLRIGHPARVTANVLQHCFDAQVSNAENTAIVDDIRMEIQQMERTITNIREKARKQKRTQTGQTCDLYKLIRSNRKEIHKRERNVIQNLLQQSHVIFATNMGASTKLLKDIKFDIAIIDEAAQALEVSCWIPIMKAKRVVLAGDHCQLPPTIKSRKAAEDGLQVTLFDRLMERAKMRGFEGIVKMLDIQYRMHDDICRWSSDAMYQSALKSFEGVAARTLQDLGTFVRHENEVFVTLPEGVFQVDPSVLGATLYLLDTAGCDLNEEKEQVDTSKFKKDKDARDIASVLSCSKSNPGEALLVDIHVRSLVQAGIPAHDIAVITPYNKQVQVLKSRLSEAFPSLEIRSVDGFQGCEKEAVVMSLVRSNKKHEAGFLADERRMNVAVTRAKRHVALICDSETISAHSFLRNLVQHFEAFGEVRFATEILSEYSVSGERVVEKRRCNRSRGTRRPVTQKDTVEPSAKNYNLVSISKASELKRKVESDIQDDDEILQTAVAFEVLASSSSCDEGDNDIEGDGTAETSKHEYTCIPDAVRKPNVRSSKKKGKKGKAISKVTKEIAESSFLDRQVAESRFCGFRDLMGIQCEERTHLVYGSICICCKARFCLKHIQAEIHGCTRAIRERAVQQDKAHRTMTSQQKNSLKQKLHSQMEAKTKGRAKKSVQKKKK